MPTTEWYLAVVAYLQRNNGIRLFLSVIFGYLTERQESSLNTVVVLFCVVAAIVVVYIGCYVLCVLVVIPVQTYYFPCLNGF